MMKKGRRSKNNVTNENNENNINLQTSNKKMLKDIFSAVYVANIKRCIDEDRYIQIIKSISDNGFKTYYIKDFDRLTVYLKEQGLNKSYAISILLYLRDENYNKIVEIARQFTDIKKIINNKSKKTVEKVHEVSKSLRKKLDIAKAFIKPEKIESIYSNVDEIELKLDRELVINEWFIHNRRDIINRLHDLLKHFTIEQLEFMGVSLIRYDVLLKTDTIELQKYYNQTVNCIIDCIKFWKKTCFLYVDVDLGYLEMCFDIDSGRDPTLKLKSFEIIIV